MIKTFCDICKKEGDVTRIDSIEIDVCKDCGAKIVKAFEPPTLHHRTCPDCGVTSQYGREHKPGCEIVWGRRGWRQLGVYDG